MAEYVTFADIKKSVEHEKSVLLRGEFSELSKILERKERFFGVLSKGTLSVSRAEAMSIKDSLSENQSILSASLSGLKAAQEKLEQIQEVMDSVRIYKRNGSFAKGARGLVERKF